MLPSLAAVGSAMYVIGVVASFQTYSFLIASPLTTCDCAPDTSFASDRQGTNRPPANDGSSISQAGARPGIYFGLLGRETSVPLLVGVLEDRGQEKMQRGSAALALGLIGDHRADRAVMSALAERENRDLRVQTARAAGLLRIPAAEKLLVEVLRDPKASQFTLGSVALALGRIGGDRSMNRCSRSSNRIGRTGRTRTSPAPSSSSRSVTSRPVAGPTLSTGCRRT